MREPSRHRGLRTGRPGRHRWPAAGSKGGRRAGGRAARALVELNTARAGEGPWTPERVNANAERAADDPGAIAYLGELAYSASALSVPITNHAQ